MNDQQTKKQSYVRPMLKRVELKADEVLDSGCKTAAITSTFGESTVCGNNTCNTQGS